MAVFGYIFAALFTFFLVRRIVRAFTSRGRWRRLAEEGAFQTLRDYRRNCVCTIEGIPFDDSGAAVRQTRAREVRTRGIRKPDRRSRRDEYTREQRALVRRRDDKRKAALR